MFVGADLAAWLADFERRGEVRAAAERLARDWAETAAIQELKHELHSMEPKTADGVLAAARRFMARADEFGALIHRYVAGAARDPFFRPHFLPIVSDVATGILLYGDPSTTISIGTTSADALAAKKSGVRGPSSIAFSGLRTAFHFLKGGGATLSFWEAPERSSALGDDGSRPCRFVSSRRIDDGETLLLDGRTQSFVIEHAASDMIYLHAEAHVEQAPLAVEYDSRTLALVGASSTDEAASRVQMMVSLLRLMDRRDAAPLIAQLIERSPFHARWYLMRELLALDAEAALPVLQRMAANDPHEEIRETAARTLALFFGDEEEPARCRA